MKEIQLAVRMTSFGSAEGTAEQFEAFLDQVMAELDSIGREVTLAARLDEQLADFAVTIEADDFAAAACDFLADIRMALHAAVGEL